MRTVVTLLSLAGYGVPALPWPEYGTRDPLHNPLLHILFPPCQFFASLLILLIGWFVAGTGPNIEIPSLCEGFLCRSLVRRTFTQGTVRRVSTDHIVTWGGRRNRRSEGSHRPPSV